MILPKGWHINKSFNISNFFEFHDLNKDVVEISKAMKKIFDFHVEDASKSLCLPTKIIDEQEICVRSSCYTKYLIKWEDFCTH